MSGLIERAEACWLPGRQFGAVIIWDPPYAVQPMRGREDGAAGIVFGAVLLPAPDHVDCAPGR